jgi:membrane-associated phospholipid phosphatase
VDEALLLAINGLRSPELDAIFGPIGDWGLYAYPALLLVLLAIRRRPAAPTARDGIFAWLVALFVAESVLKPLIARARPTALPALLERLAVLGTVPSARSFSMPSGSATACAAGAAWIWIRLGWRAGLPAALFALVVSLSRIYAGIHWPSDLLAGLAIGALIAAALDRFSRWADPTLQ